MRRSHLTLGLIVPLLIISLGCSISLPMPNRTEQKPKDLYAFSMTPKTPAEREADEKACENEATRMSNFDRNLEKKWLERKADEIMAFWGLEIDQDRWNRAWSGCMGSRGYKVSKSAGRDSRLFLFQQWSRQMQSAPLFFGRFPAKTDQACW